MRRGPDLKPRNLLRAVCLKAMTDPSELALPSASKRSGVGKRKRAIERHAMIHNMSKAMQNIMRDAAEGNVKAYGPCIKLVTAMHDMLQPTPDETKNGGGPILPKFNRPVRSVPAPAPEAPAEDLPAVVDKDGNVYVDPEA